jgi:HTH-type transcriptional regulator, sugar sensing transcriptional regulator
MFEELKDFGLSENEITTYVALLKAGNVSANRISKITGMKRSTTYDNLNLLINKGIVSTVMKSGVNYYESADPNKIIRLMDDKRLKISKIVPKLISLKESAKEKTGVTFFEGKKGVITILNDILDEKKELLFYGSRKVALIAWQDYPDNFIKKRADSKISLKAVLADEDRGDPAYKDKKIYDLSKLKFLKELDKIKTNVFIYSDKVAFMTSGENIIGTIIKNKEIVEQQKKIFQILWKQAKK